MTYATEQHMVDRFAEQELVELTDRVGVGRIDSAVLARALTDADGEINGYLATRYTLPLVAVPIVLVRIACDITFYLLDRRSESARTHYQDAIKFLRAVADGVVSLGADAANAAPVEAGGPKFDAGGRVFTRTRADGTEGSLDDYR